MFPMKNLAHKGLKERYPGCVWCIKNNTQHPKYRNISTGPFRNVSMDQQKVIEKVIFMNVTIELIWQYSVFNGFFIWDTLHMFSACVGETPFIP